MHKLHDGENAKKLIVNTLCLLLPPADSADVAQTHRVKRAQLTPHLQVNRPSFCATQKNGQQSRAARQDS